MLGSVSSHSVYTASYGTKNLSSVSVLPSCSGVKQAFSSDSFYPPALVHFAPTSAHLTTYSMGWVSSSTVMKSAPRASGSDEVRSVSVSSIRTALPWSSGRNLEVNVQRLLGYHSLDSHLSNSWQKQEEMSIY